MPRIITFGFWSALVFAFTMAVLPSPPDLPVPSSDKLQHMLAFATLAVLGAVSYPRMPLAVLAIGLAGLGALIEVVQMIPALHRNAEVADFVADSAAILAALVVVAAVRGARALQMRLLAGPPPHIASETGQ